MTNRAALIRLASTLSVGDPDRKVLLASALKVGSAAGLLPLARKVDKAVLKLMGRVPRLLKTIDRHEGGYKGDPAKAERAKDTFYKEMEKSMFLLQGLIAELDAAVAAGELPSYLDSDAGGMIPIRAVKGFREGVRRRDSPSDIWEGRVGDSGAYDWLETLERGGYEKMIQQAIEHYS